MSLITVVSGNYIIRRSIYPFASFACLITKTLFVLGHNSLEPLQVSLKCLDLLLLYLTGLCFRALQTNGPVFKLFILKFLILSCLTFISGDGNL